MNDLSEMELILKSLKKKEMKEKCISNKFNQHFELECQKQKVKDMFSQESDLKRYEEEKSKYSADFNSLNFHLTNHKV